MNDEKSTQDMYLDMMFEGRKHPKAWMWNGRYLRLGADAIYTRYLESKDWLEKHSIDKDGKSFHIDFVDNNKDVMTKHQLNLTLLQSYFFLEGCALENAVKAVLISVNPDNAPHKNNKKITSHNLQCLFENAKISLDKWQINLLERLTDCIYWAGRYPYPLERKELQYKPLPDGGVYLAGQYKEGDQELIESLWSLLVSRWNNYWESIKT